MKGVETSGAGSGPEIGSNDRIGRYRLLQILGEGGMGVVHLAEDPEGRRVAIKVLRPQVAADQTAVRRLAREVDTMRRVHSPYVAEIIDADVTATRPYVVTRFVPGRTLEEIVLDSGPLAGRALQRLAAGLAQALAAIHGAGVIHRDLKPGNVMLQSARGEGDPVLIDFGIAQGLDASRLTATGMVIGTPGYLAPEIIEGEEAGPPADIHAWAGTLAFAATGRPPFGSGTFESIFFKIMQGTPDLAGVPAPMLPLIRAAMARHPAERPTAVNLVQLARRIDLNATITDQTRVDRPLGEFGLPAPPPRSSTSGETAAPKPSAGPATDETLVDTATARLPEVAAGLAAEAVAAKGAEAGAAAVKGRDERVQQPRDFVGMLPPAVPPAPPRTEPRRGPRPYVPPPPSQHAGYSASAPPGYQPYTQPGQHPAAGAAPGQYGQHPGAGGYPPPYGQQPPAGARPGEPEAAKEQRRKPYGWYRLCSLATLAMVLGMAAMAPVMTLVIALGAAAVLRAADRAAQSMESKRTRRGPGSGDVIGAVVKTPFALPGAVLKTALWGGLHLFAGAAVVVVLMVANPTMTIAKAVSYGAMVVLVLHFLGPGSVGPRRQMARVWSTLLPRSEPAVLVTLCLGVFAALLFSTAVQSTPDLQPVRFADSGKTLNDLRNGVQTQMPSLPFG